MPNSDASDAIWLFLETFLYTYMESFKKGVNSVTSVTMLKK